MLTAPAGTLGVTMVAVLLKAVMVPSSEIVNVWSSKLVVTVPAVRSWSSYNSTKACELTMSIHVAIIA